MRGIAGPRWLRIALVAVISLGGLSPIDGRSVAADSQAAPGLELVAQFGGITYAMAVDGTRVYLGVGPRLVVLDVADPAHPSVAGQSELLQVPIKYLAVDRDYAYVVADHLRIFAVSDPERIVEVGSYVPLRGTYLAGLTVVGRLLYVASGGGLRILDVSDAASPTEMASESTLGQWYSNVSVVGPYAYVTGHYDGSPRASGSVRIVDVSDPVRPRHVSLFTTGFESYTPGIAVEGPHAFVAIAGSGWSGQAGDLRVLDVSDSASLKLVGTALIGPSHHVAVSGTHAYVTARGVIRVLDVRDPSHPVQVGSHQITGDPRSLVLHGRYAYVLDEDGLRIVDVSDPVRPAQVGLYEPLQTPFRVVTAGRFAYVLSTGRLQIFDVADPARPIRLGVQPLSCAWKLTVAAHYAFVSCSGGGVSIIDVSDPAHPAEIGSYAAGWTEGLAIQGRYAYVTAHPGHRQEWGLHVVDISTPARPVRVGTLEMGDYTWEVAVDGRHAYVITGCCGIHRLHVIDVSSPAMPKQIASRPVTYPRSIAAQDRHVYLNADGALLIFDVSDPSKPKQVGRYEGFRFGTIMGAHAFSGSYGGIKVLDVSDPSNPHEVAAQHTGWPGEVSVQAEYVYAATGGGGLWIFRFTSPSAPKSTLSHPRELSLADFHLQQFE